jgi:hypothetical protein
MQELEVLPDGGAGCRPHGAGGCWGSDAEEIDQLSRQLRRQLLELEVARVDPVTSEVVAGGVKAGELLAVGALVVSLVNSSGLLAAVVAQVQAALARMGRHTVRLEIDGDVLEVTGVASSEQQRLIDAWINRHGDR